MVEVKYVEDSARVAKFGFRDHLGLASSAADIQLGTLSANSLVS